MTHSQAIKIAMASICREQRLYTFDRHLAEHGFGGAAGKCAKRKWERLERAKLVLKQDKLL